MNLPYSDSGLYTPKSQSVKELFHCKDQGIKYHRLNCIDNKYKQKMYFLIYKYSLLVFWIVLLGIFSRVPVGEAQFVLKTLIITENGQGFRVPYNNTFEKMPTNFAYFIQKGTVNEAEFYLNHNATATTIGVSQISIRFLIEGVSNMSTTQLLQIKLMVSAYPSESFTLTIVSTTTSSIPANLQLPVIYNPASMIKNLQVKVFVLNIPMTHTQTLNSTHLSITPTFTPTNAISKISFSVLIITRNFVSYHVGLLIDDVKLGSLGWIIIFNNETFFDPSDSTMLIGITNYEAASNPVFNLTNGADYNFSFPLSPDKRSIFVYYEINSTSPPTVMDISLFLFTPSFTGCDNKGFLTYAQLYYDSPLSCSPCHITCETCTTANYSLTMTDQSSCLTCGPLKYFKETTNGSGVGKCKCYPGLEIDNDTQMCLACVKNCFGFTIDFMRSSSQSQFFLKFSSLADLLIPMEQNLKIYINSSNSAQFTVRQVKTNFYQIIIPPHQMTACNTKCLIVFQFEYPWKVLKHGKNQALSDTNESVEIQNYYVVGDKIPQELSQALTVSSMLVGAAAGGGLSSMLKMLFEIEQMIEFHKYLNIQMPLIFKEFIESLSIFKFLDIMIVFPFDIDVILQNLSTQDFNTKGPVKAVYYESGANFYKNIISVVVSFAVVLIINFTLFLVMRLIPCKLFWRFSQKLRVRSIITFSDLVQTMIIPIIVFADFQLSVIYYRMDILWIYAMAMGMVFFILSIPFFLITWVFKKQNDKEMKSVYEDLMNDCHLDRPATYAFFVVGYYRKIMFGISLMSYIPGMIQGYCVIAFNTIYLGFLIYVVSQRIFNSKLKMLTKTLNVICVIGIEAIMIHYNYKQHGIEKMLDLGASCVYLAIISTITGVFEALIKIFQIICQNVKDIQSERQVNIQEELKNLTKLQRRELTLDKAIKNPIYSNIGKQQNFLPFNSKDSLETASFESSKQKQKTTILQKARNKFGFTASLNKNNQENKNEQVNLKEGESLEQIMQKIDGDNLVSLDSTDEFGYGIRKREIIRNRLGQKNQASLQRQVTISQPHNQQKGTQNKVQRAYNKIQNEQKPKPSQNIDQEIQIYQQRRRKRQQMKKLQSQSKNTLQTSTNIKEVASSVDRQPKNRQNQTNIMNSRRQYPNRVRRANTFNEPITQRLKHEENDQNMMENINEKKTARRRTTTNKRIDSLEVKHSRRYRDKNERKQNEDNDQDDDDIYYPK